MMEEYESIMKKSVWEVVPRPTNKSVLAMRWIFKVKHAIDESIGKCKDIFVAKGFSIVEGIDYEEAFSPVERYSYIRSILALVAQMGWKIHEMDVKKKILNHVIKEEVYNEQPEGDEQMINSCKEDLARELDMKDMGLMHYLLELEVWQGDGKLFMSQGKYATEIFQRFRMESCHSMETHLATNWRKENATSREEVDATIYR
eukprot:PITA_31894